MVILYYLFMFIVNSTGPNIIMTFKIKTKPCGIVELMMMTNWKGPHKYKTVQDC